MNRLWLVSMIVFMSVGLACKSSAPKQKPKEKAASDDQVIDPVGNDDTTNDVPAADDCTTNSSSNDNDDEDDENDENDEDSDDGFDLRAFFGLQDTKVTYESDVKTILAAKCISCHAGVTEPDVSTYAAAKNASSSIVSQVESGKMPPGAPLGDNDKKKLQQWITDGTLEKESTSGSDDDSSSDDDDNNSSSGSSSNCDTTSDDNSSDDESDDDDSEVADWEDFLNPERLKECKDKDKIYDRVEQDCHKASIASFDCDKAGVIAHFKKSGVDVESTYDSITGDGYEIDQCGEFSGEPIVLFMKKNETSSELKLKIRKLCKKDSEACSS